jgi:hypothetical protein
MAGLEGPTSHQPFVTPADRRALRLRQSSKLASQPEMTLRAARTTTPNNHHSGPSRPGYARRMQQHRLGTAGRDRHAENEVERSRLHRRLMALRLRRTLRLALACPLALEAVRALLSDDHSAEAGEAAVRKIIAEVVRVGGTDALADLTAELASKLAEMVERAACTRGLAAVDVVDILFVD